MNVPYLISPQFFLYFIYFVFAIFIAVYIPGNILIRRLKVSFLETTTLSLVTGIALLALQGFILGYLNIRWLSYFYLVTAFVVWLLLNRKLKFKFPKISLDLTTFSILFFGILGQLSGIWLMGARFSNGIHIAGGHAPDNNLELAITNEIVHRFPPFEPGMFGVLLQNYHYWSHLFSAELIRIFNLPLIATQYQYLTIFISILIGLLVISISRVLNFNKYFTNWFLFFIYSGADLSFIILLFLGKGLNFSMMPLESGMEFLFNLPRAMSIIIFLGALYLLIVLLKKKDILISTICGIMLGTIIGFKVYTGIFALFGLIPLTLYQLHKRRYRFLITTSIAFFVSILIYLPVNKNAGGLFFTGFWRVNDFIVLPSLGLSHLELARIIYQQHNNYLKVYLLEILFLVLYLISTFGTKLLGLIQSKNSLSTVPKEVNLFLIPPMAISLIIGLFFWQNTGGPNTFNFLISVLIIGSFYTALACSYFTQNLNKKLKYALVLIIILLTIPRYFQIIAWNNDNNQKKFELIDNYQLGAFNYININTTPNSLILASRNIGSDSDGPYISYITDRPVYLAGERDNLLAHGISFSDRKKTVDIIFSSNNAELVKNQLKKAKINYLIIKNANYFYFAKGNDFLSPVYRNNEYTVFKVSP